MILRRHWLRKNKAADLEGLGGAAAEGCDQALVEQAVKKEGGSGESGFKLGDIDVGERASHHPMSTKRRPGRS